MATTKDAILVSDASPGTNTDRTNTDLTPDSAFELHAIRHERVDGFVVDHAKGQRVLMLEAPDRPYKILVEKMQQGAVATSADGTVLYCNRRFTEMLRRPVGKIVGKSIYGFLATPSQTAYAEVAGSGGGQGEFGLMQADGEVIPIHVAVNAVEDSDGVSYLIVTDLTDQLARRRAEQLAETLTRELEERKVVEEALRVSEARFADQSRRKDQFLAVLSHEIRGPLAPIQNALHVLHRVPEGPLAQDARAILERQITQMARITDDLFDLSRISGGTILLRKERLDLTGLVRRCVEDYRTTLEGAGLRVETHVPDRPLWMRGDPTRLFQVFANILQNAVKFTEAGGTVRISLSAYADGKTAMARIQDTGIGMTEEKLERVFEAFRPGARSYDQGSGGLGIGMALAKGLTELHAGRIFASSAGAGRGSEFTIELPLEHGAPPREQPSHAAPAPVKSYRVLVIEDNIDAAESLEMLLSLIGHVVEKAYDGPVGVEIAKRFRPEVVLCDIGLPGPMDGHAVAQILRRDFPRGAAFLIALTGYGQHEDQRRSYEAGFDFHMTKPADPKELEKMLASLASQI